MLQDYSHLLRPVFEIAEKAGKAVMEIYQSDRSLSIQTKSDNTPVTEADLAAHDIILAALMVLTPDLPVLSEESTSVSFAERQKWECYWLIDPLDGTKEFIDRTDQFSINIALILNHIPVLGMVYSPVEEVAYEACRGFGAFKRYRDGTYDYLETVPHQRPVRLVLSRRHGNRTREFLSHFGEHEILHCGSALKFGWVAEGKADIYPRLGNTSEWDTAAGQCVVEEAGGRVIDFQGQDLRYNTRDSLINPPFLVLGEREYEFK
jgi:3'(2'), 5'-bisphosphate nucleotidase